MSQKRCVFDTDRSEDEDEDFVTVCEQLKKQFAGCPLKNRAPY